MSEHAAHASAPAAATFELLWQQDASAFALVRGADGTLSAGDLQLGMPAESVPSALRTSAKALASCCHRSSNVAAAGADAWAACSDTNLQG